MGRPALLPPPGATGGARVPRETRDRGACATTGNPDRFFDEDDPSEALALCGRCPVRAACLDYALDHEQHGVWGGTTPAERRALRGGPLHSPEDRRSADLVRARVRSGWPLEAVAAAEGVNERTLKRWREHPDQPAAA